MDQIDISVGFVFSDDPHKLIVITTDKDDMTRPSVLKEDIPKRIFNWSDFNDKINKWSSLSDSDDIDFEYYEVTCEKIFNNICNNVICKIDLICISSCREPVAIKIFFESDYIISSPINDGNSVETRNFNKINNLVNFSCLGDLVFLDVESFS